MRNEIKTLWKNIKNRVRHSRSYVKNNIKLCESWYDFENFYEHIKPIYKAGLQADRIDTYKGYEPNNIRFVTHKENMRNIRTKVYFNYNGEMKRAYWIWEDLTKTLTPSVTKENFYSRLKKGMNPCDAFTVRDLRIGDENIKDFYK